LEVSTSFLSAEGVSIGRKTVTLKGERIAEEFQAIVEGYVKQKYG
jgi:hypothetical protein